MKYFLHDTSSFDDEKITELYLKFGYEGLGLFYTTLEKIGRQEKPVKTDVLKAQLRVGKRLNKCWNFMESIGLLSSTDGETFNEQLLNFSEKYQIKKEKTREKVAEWRKKQADKKNVTNYETVSNHPKVKESKVNKSKVSKEDSKPDFIRLILTEFQEAYKITGSEYEILNVGKERTAIAKLLKVYKGKYPDSTSDETLAGLRAYFDTVVLIPDDWIRKNMSPTIIISKFNEINNIINGNKRQNSKGGATGRQLAELFVKKFTE